MDDPTHTNPGEQGWARHSGQLHVAAADGAVGYNVEGRLVSGPHQGFGRLWKRDYWADLGTEVTPEHVIAQWRAHFGDYWPKGGHFHGAATGISPGDVAPLAVGPDHGPKLATGVLVIYADDQSFTFMTPEGHMFAGLITFSAGSIEERTEVRISILLRTNDPLYELGWPVLKLVEDRFWPGVLRNLAAGLGVGAVTVQSHTECVDRRRQWRRWRNVRHNAGIRSAWHTLAAPVRWMRGRPATGGTP
jgi:hypothetical protein